LLAVSYLIQCHLFPCLLERRPTYERSVLLPPSSVGSWRRTSESRIALISPNRQTGAPVRVVRRPVKKSQSTLSLPHACRGQPSLHGSCAIWGRSSLEYLYDAAARHRLPRFTTSHDSSHPLHSCPELENHQKTVSTTTLRYSLMKHPTPNTRHTRASRPMTLSGTRNRQHASRCSYAISSRTRCTIPTMGIFHSRQPSLHLRGPPSISAPCATR